MSKTIAINLKVNGVEQSVTTLNQLETSIEQIKEELKGTDFGSEKFKQLSKDLQKAQSELKDFEKEFEGLDTNQKAESFLKVGEAIAGGFAIGQGALAIFGAESEKLAEIQTKVQGAIAIAVGARAIAEGALQARIAARIVQEKAYQAVQAISTLVIGGTTGALKLFRIALASTGVGLLIIALGALVANFDKIKKAISENSQSWKNFKNILMFVAPPLWLIIKGVELLQEKFGGLRQMIAAVGAAFMQFFSSVGEAFSLLIKGEFRAALKAITDIPKEVKVAAKRAVKEVNDAIAEEERKIRVKHQIEARDREIKYLEALGKDTYALRKKQLQDELSLLEKGSKEYLDKLNEIRILDAQQRKKQLDDALKKQREEIDAQIKGFDKYKTSIEALNSATVPQVEATEELNELLKEQKQILQEIKSPLDKFNESVSEVDIPTDDFGAFYEATRNVLEQNILTKTREEYDELANSLIELVRLQSEGAEITDEQVEAYRNLFVGIKGVSEKELELAIKGLTGDRFTQEAFRAFQVIVEAGYKSAFVQLEKVSPEQSRALLGALGKVFQNVKKSLIEIDPLTGELFEKFYPFDPNAAAKLEEELRKSFQQIYGFAADSSDKAGELFNTWRQNLEDTIFGTAELEQEIRAIFANSRNLEDEINANVKKGTIERLKILDKAYGDYTQALIDYDSAYTDANAEELRKQNSEVFERLKKELDAFEGTQEEKEAMLKSYQKKYDAVEKEITDNVKEEAQKRVEAEKKAFEDKYEKQLEFLDGIAKAADEIEKLISDITDIQIANLDRVFDKRFDELENQYNEDLLKAGDNARKKNRIEREYNAERIALEEEYEAERRRLMKKALLAELFANTLNIVSETAKNVVKGFPNPFLMAGAGILGLAQGAIAVAQYNTARKLRRGGLLMAKGQRHAQGGILMPTGDEIEGGELILPREVAMNEQALGLAQAASSMVGGTNFAQEIGRFDSMYNQQKRREDFVINAVVVADEVQRENVLDKKIRDRARI